MVPRWAIIDAEQALAEDARDDRVVGDAEPPSTAVEQVDVQQMPGGSPPEQVGSRAAGARYQACPDRRPAPRCGYPSRCPASMKPTPSCSPSSLPKAAWQRRVMPDRDVVRPPGRRRASTHHPSTSNACLVSPGRSGTPGRPSEHLISGTYRRADHRVAPAMKPSRTKDALDIDRARPVGGTSISAGGADRRCRCRRWSPDRRQLLRTISHFSPSMTKSPRLPPRVGRGQRHRGSSRTAPALSSSRWAQMSPASSRRRYSSFCRSSATCAADACWLRRGEAVPRDRPSGGIAAASNTTTAAIVERPAHSRPTCGDGQPRAAGGTTSSQQIPRWAVRAEPLVVFG